MNTKASVILQRRNLWGFRCMSRDWGRKAWSTGYMIHPVQVSHPELFLPRAGTGPSYPGFLAGRLAVGPARSVGRSDETTSRSGPQPLLSGPVCAFPPGVHADVSSQGQGDGSHVCKSLCQLGPQWLCEPRSDCSVPCHMPRPHH